MATVLKHFKWAEDGITLEYLVPGDRRDNFATAHAGLLAAGYIGEDPADADPEPPAEPVTEPVAPEPAVEPVTPPADVPPASEAPVVPVAAPATVPAAEPVTPAPEAPVKPKKSHRK